MTTVFHPEPEVIRWYTLEAAPCFSSNAGFAPSTRLGYDNYESTPTVARCPEHAFVARCKNCHREYHLDPDRPIPPVFCGLGITHGCGSSDWHVFKRLIEVEEEPEYQDDCVYSETDEIHRPGSPYAVTKHHRLVGMYAEPGCIALSSMTRKEASTLRDRWERIICHVGEEADSLFRGRGGARK